MSKANERIAVLEARYEHVTLLEQKVADLTMWIKCGAYLLSALLTHVVASPWASALGASLSGSP